MSTAAQLAQANGADTSLPRAVLRHYTVAEIASLWNLSDDAVRNIFEKEPGVLVIGDQRTSIRKRRYMTLRIPADVLELVHRRLSRP
jgi:hypothetical protein